MKTTKEASLLTAMKRFINDIGMKPQRMIADRDFKLIGGAVANFLETPEIIDDIIHTTLVAGAPELTKSRRTY